MPIPTLRQYRISGFLRGRLGTEHNVSTHTAADDVVVINDRVQPIRVPMADFNRAVPWRFVTAGLGVDIAPETVFTLQANSLKPPAPTHLQGSRNTAGDLLIVWTRRERIWLPLRDFAGTPLSEETEVYVVEIYSGSTLKRRVRVSHVRDFTKTAVWIKFFDPGSEVTINADQSLSAASAVSKPVVVSVEHFSGDFTAEFTRTSDAPPKHIGVMPAADNDPEDGLSATGFPYYQVSSDTFYPMANLSYGVTSADGDKFTIQRRGNIIRFYKNPHLSAVPVPIYETTFTSTEQLKLFAKFGTAGQGLAPTSLSLTTPRSYNYTASQQVDDFSSTQSSVKVRVMQESSIVGVGPYVEGNL